MAETAVEFNVAKAKEVLKRAIVVQNNPGKLEFTRFGIIRGKTQTIVAVNHYGGEVHMRVDVVDLEYCMDQVNISSYNRYGGGDFHYVKSIEYDNSECDPSITFYLPSKSGVPSWVRVHNDGRWSFKVA